MSRQLQTLGALAKLTVFAIVSALVLGMLTVILGNVGFNDTSTYKAVFTSASRLQDGDDVRVAGVVVGQVEGVEIKDRTKALVTFSVGKDVPLTRASRAEIKYLNLVGDRYLALQEGKGSAQPLSAGGTIPVSHTKPALNLNALFNGFKPLFQALSPKQVNRLSMEIIKTLQGQGGTINSLLSHTASLTTTIANRDKLIGEVIGNLNSLLATLDQRHKRLSSLVKNLQKWVSGLAADSDVIGASLEHINELTTVTGDLVADARPALEEDIEQLSKLAATLSEPKNKRRIERLIQKLPERLNKMTRTGTYGSWYNFYVCDLKVNITFPEIPQSRADEQLQAKLGVVLLHSKAARCKS